MPRPACLALVLAVPLLLTPAVLAEIDWLEHPDGLVDTAVGYEAVQTAPDGWHGTVAAPHDPIIELNAMPVPAESARYLYIHLSVDSGLSMQVFYSPAATRGFSEARSVRTGGVMSGRKPHCLRIDMADSPAWAGTIERLRLDLEGARPGTEVTLHGVGWSSEPVEVHDSMPVISESARAPQQAADRSAAWHRTVVTMHTAKPGAALMTYDLVSSYHGLAKLVPGIRRGDDITWASEAEQVEVRDIPGGIEASFTLEGTRIHATMVALPVGRGDAATRGAALYTIYSDTPAEVVIRCGVPVTAEPNALRADLTHDGVGGAGDSCEILPDGDARLTSPRHPLVVQLRSDGDVAAAPTQDDAGQCAEVAFAEGSGRIVLAFAPDGAAAAELASLDPDSERARLDAHYEELLQSRVETPLPALDEAFRAALITLEYTWLAPFGWVESIRHWPYLWHMQVSGAADWIGQEARSRACIVAHAERQLPGGGAPQLTTGGETHREIFTGGSNQFYAWQIRQHIMKTGDLALAEELAPVLDALITQTFAEYDGDGDLLLRWDPQIGNQEDYIWSPFNATSPAIEGAEMLRTRAALAQAIGDSHTADRMTRKAELIETRTRDTLWQERLGRFAFFADPRGLRRPDPPYHTLVYPPIYGLVDEKEAYTSVRHLRDRLMGRDGRVYASNNFPTHGESTSGVQAGAAQQPWGAWGLAAVGLRNEAYRPLAAVAAWVAGDVLEGSWPEVSDVPPIAAYFSPPAGLCIQAVIEALFGLKVDKLDGVLHVAPCMPDDWPAASLHLPGFSAHYERQGNTWRYTVESEDPLPRKLRWPLPAADVAGFTVNGEEADFALLPGVDCVFLESDTAPEARTVFEVVLHAEVASLEGPGSVAEGDRLEVTAVNCHFTGIEDPGGVLSAAEKVSSSEARGHVRTGLLAPYKGYGPLGLLNFARRTFFVAAETELGTPFWLPVDLAVLPRFEAAATGPVAAGKDNAALTFLLRNNTSSAVEGKALLHVAGESLPMALDLGPRSEVEAEVPLDTATVARLTPGANRAVVQLPDGSEEGFTFAVDLSAEELANSRERMAPVSLPDHALRPDTDIFDLRKFYAVHWTGPEGHVQNLSSFTEETEVELPELPGVPFRLSGRQWAPVSFASGSPHLSVDLEGRHFRKLYILVTSFLDNHDTFVPVARLAVRQVDGHIRSVLLSSPGDLDWGFPEHAAYLHRTATQPRESSFPLLPLLSPDSSDWAAGKPPAFPQPSWWAEPTVVARPSITMNVIEVETDPSRPLRSLAVETLGVDPAVAIVAVTGLPPRDPDRVTPLFALNTSGDLEGWALEGEAFAVRECYSYVSLNSQQQPELEGTAMSPLFQAEKGELRFLYYGGGSPNATGPGALSVGLVDGDTDELLTAVRVMAPGQRVLQHGAIRLDEWAGRPVRLMLRDENVSPGAGWIGLRDVVLVHHDSPWR